MSAWIERRNKICVFLLHKFLGLQRHCGCGLDCGRGHEAGGEQFQSGQPRRGGSGGVCRPARLGLGLRCPGGGGVAAGVVLPARVGAQQ